MGPFIWMIFFTADTHFDHANILHYTNRCKEFDNVDDMNTAIIDRWNKVINPGDVVYHLGDFAFAGLPRWAEIRSRLNGAINLIYGNHDLYHRTVSKIVNAGIFETVAKRFVGSFDGIRMVLSHFPEVPSDDIINLHGHLHKEIGTFSLKFSKAFDVGIDGHNLTPWSLDEIIEQLKENQVI